MRTTIDFGIDLGTTNSAIAMLQGAAVTVFRREAFDYTPSAVWLDRQGRVVVGRAAWDQQDRDLENVHVEFKPQMGKAIEYTFARSGRRMKPEELSAEVLKSLKANVGDTVAEPVTAAVVTVPADFNLDQVEATARAAALAGIERCPTYPEPAAAALAYGFQSDREKVFWLVYDLGGGTFDAALIQLRDGRIEVTDHGGDKHLGGKYIDWDIVEQVLVPALTRDRRLSDFRRGNDKWRSAFAKLKRHTEEAKIRLSYAPSAPITIDNLCRDDRGEQVDFDYDLTRGEVEKIAEPFIRRSINICRQVLAANRLSGPAIEKLLLVGGPTLGPGLRGLLADPREGLGIPLEFSIDPMTVVARGAAIYAGSQLLPPPPPRAGRVQFTVELEYAPIGRDSEPLVGGKVVPPPGREIAGCSLELVNAEARPPWRSGRIELSATGAFTTRLAAGPGANVFVLELRDGGGARLEAVPDSLRYVWGTPPGDLPLIHSVGVEMANNGMDLFLEKGTPLPARTTRTHLTTIGLRRGSAADLLRIPVVEGENRLRADRNRRVGMLQIHADAVARDLPEGSDIEITIEIDASRRVRTSAYVPLLDMDFEEVLSLGGALPGGDSLAQAVKSERDRLAEARRKVGTGSDARAQEILRRIDGERLGAELTSSFGAAASAPDAADRCQGLLLELAGRLDEIDAALEWPSLRAEAEEELADMHKAVREHGDEEEERAAATMEHELRQAIEAEDPAVVRLKIDDVGIFTVRVLQKKPGYWAGLFNHLKLLVPRMSDPARAAQLFAQGQRALASNDLAGTRAACRELIELLPSSERKGVEGGTGTTVSKF